MGSDKGAIFSREHSIQISDRRLLLCKMSHFGPSKSEKVIYHQLLFREQEFSPYIDQIRYISVVFGRKFLSRHQDVYYFGAFGILHFRQKTVGVCLQ